MNYKKTAAIKLRESGYSYAMIRKELDVPLGTLSSWFKNKPFKPNEIVLKRIRSGQYSYGERRKQERLAETAKLLQVGRQEVGELSERDIWMIGLGLWVGEGSKTTEQIRLANSDPKVIALWVRWLQEICGLHEENIFLTLHTYEDVDEERCKKYWREITGLPSVHFGKTQVDFRKNKSLAKKGSLPYGTVHISVRSMGDSQKGVKLYRRFKGWISAILDIA